MASEPRHIAPPQARIPLHGLLRLAAQQAEDEFYAGVRAHGFDEIRPGHGCVFGTIADEGSRLTDLAIRAGYTKQTVGEVATELERLGYVERVPDPEDARARLVKTTPKGHELIDVSLPVVREVEASWKAHLGPVRTRQLRSILTALREITDPFAAPHD